MITEDYVSYEVAQLLKEKGFDWEVRAYYQYDSDTKEWDFEIDDREDSPSLWGDYHVSAPTHQMAMKWLREVHNLHIAIERGPKGYHISIETIPLGVVKYITREIVGTTYIDSYEEAVEAALKYSFENLI